MGASWRPLLQAEVLPGDHAASRQPVAGSGFALSHARLLQDVSRERLELLSRECAWYRYGKGAEIIAQQVMGREVYFIASGAVRVRTHRLFLAGFALAQMALLEQFAHNVPT